MPESKVLHCPGGTLFFTVSLASGAGFTLLDKLHLLRIAYSEALEENPFRTEAIVILPDHLHAVWTLPQGDSAYSLRWRKIKGRFTRMVKHSGPRTPRPLRNDTREIWQTRFEERLLRDRTETRAHMEYCWSDPVRHSLAAKPSDWDASSIHREIRNGRLAADWGGPVGSGTPATVHVQPDLLAPQHA